MPCYNESTLEDVIVALWNQVGDCQRVFNYINFRDDGSRVCDARGNVCPIIDLEYIQQVIDRSA
jgi:hypothetical protein